MSLETCQHLPDLTALDFVRLETCQHPPDLTALDLVVNLYLKLPALIPSRKLSGLTHLFKQDTTLIAKNKIYAGLSKFNYSQLRHLFLKSLNRDPAVAGLYLQTSHPKALSSQILPYHILLSEQLPALNPSLSVKFLPSVPPSPF